MADAVDSSFQGPKTSEVVDPDMTIRQNGEDNDNEKRQMPSGRYLTGITPVLVCIRSNILLI